MAPATVGMKNGAALGALAGSMGLFRRLISARLLRLAHRDGGSDDSVTNPASKGALPEPTIHSTVRNPRTQLERGSYTTPRARDVRLGWVVPEVSDSRLTVRLVCIVGSCFNHCRKCGVELGVRKHRRIPVSGCCFGSSFCNRHHQFLYFDKQQKHKKNHPKLSLCLGSSAHSAHSAYHPTRHENNAL